MGRTIRITRPKKMAGRFVTYQITIDNIIMAQIENDSTISLTIDSSPHVIGLVVPDWSSPGIQIPEGREGYAFSISFVTDFSRLRSWGLTTSVTVGGPCLTLTEVLPAEELSENTESVMDQYADFIAFRESLVKFMIKVFNGQGIMDRIQLENNSHHNIYIVVHDDCISVEYEPIHTRDVIQWATGRIAEKIYYSEMGLELPAELPPRWSETLLREITQGIISSNLELSCDEFGGICRTKLHRLY